MSLFAAPRGRVIRIGQMVPSSNITMETEIPALLNAHGARHGLRYTFHSSRMRMHKVTKEELVAMNREGLRCIAELTDAQVEQRIVIKGALNDPWSNTIFFRMTLNWTTDGPAVYSANYQVTLAQTVP